MTFVPYKLGTDPQFEACLPDIEVQEGVAWANGPGPARAFSNDAHDPGGKTMEGITAREYDANRKAWGLPTRPVRIMSKDEERTIYYLKYWLTYCPQLYSGLNLEFFNLNVNAGEHEAKLTLQKALGFVGEDVDGQVGPKTIAAVKAAWGSEKVIAFYKSNADVFYKRLPGFKWFGRDWLRRDVEITVQATALDKALDAFMADKPKSIMTGT